MVACEPKGIVYAQVKFITWGADSPIPPYILRGKILSRYFGRLLISMAGEAKGGRKGARKYIPPTPLRSCVWARLLLFQRVPRSIASSSSFDSQTCAGDVSLT